MARKKKQHYKPTQPKPEAISKKVSKKKNYTLLFLAAIILLTFLAYSNSFKGEFLNWDDNVYVTKSELINDLSYDGLQKMFTEYHNSNYHPLTTISFAIQNKISDQSPGLFHIVNFLFHLLNTLLVFYLIFLISKRKEVAFIVALFFGIHPMHVESVSWISEHKDLLYTFFYLIALTSYILYIKNTRKFQYLIFSLILFSLSLFSKSAAVIFPLALIIVDYYYKRKITIGLFLEKVPFFALSIVFGMLAIYSQQSDSSLNMLSSYNFIDRLFLSAYAIVYYIYKLFIPTGMSAMHYYPLKLGNFLPSGYYFVPLLIALLGYLVYKSKKLKRDLIFGLGFYLINIILVIQIIPVGRAIVAERYTYIPYIGLFFIIGQFYIMLADKKFSFATKIKTPFIAILMIYALVFTAVSWNRNKVWKNTTSLLSNIIKEYPDRGFAYYARANTKVNNQDAQGAFLDYNKAIELDPELSNAYHSRALLQYSFKKDPYAAMNDYNKCIELNPEFITAYNDRGSLKYYLGDYRGALDDYNIAVNKKPEYYLAIKNAGLAKYQLKDYKGAIQNYNQVFELKADYPEVYHFRAFAKFDSNDKEGACSDWNKALEMGYTEANEKLQENCR